MTAAVVENEFGPPTEDRLAEIRAAGDVWMTCDQLDVDVEPDQILFVFHERYVEEVTLIPRTVRCSSCGHLGQLPEPEASP